MTADTGADRLQLAADVPGVTRDIKIFRIQADPEKNPPVEVGTMKQFTTDNGKTAVRGGDAADDREAEPGSVPVTVPLRPREALEDPLLLLGAGARGLRIGYEALAWGKHVFDHRDAWEIVRRAEHPNIGLIVDSFHTLSRGIDALNETWESAREEVLAASAYFVPGRKGSGDLMPSLMSGTIQMAFATSSATQHASSRLAGAPPQQPDEAHEGPDAFEQDEAPRAELAVIRNPNRQVQQSLKFAPRRGGRGQGDRRGRAPPDFAGMGTTRRSRRAGQRPARRPDRPSSAP